MIDKNGKKLVSNLSESAASQTVEEVHVHFTRVKKQGVTEGKFARIPQSVIAELRPRWGALALYSTLMLYIPFDNSSSKCFPSMQRLSEDLEISAASVQRHLRTLKDHELVAVKKRGRGNEYRLYVPAARDVTSADESSHICDEDQSHLHAVEATETAGNTNPEGISNAGQDKEREPGKRANQEEVQACTSLLTRQRLESFRLSNERITSLIEEFGLEKIDAGIEFVDRRADVRRPAALLLSYLESGGWVKLDRLKEFLYGMPDPRTAAERASIGREIVGIFDDSKEEALKAIESVREDQLRLRSSATSEAQREIAGRIIFRASEARYFTKRYVHTAEEEQNRIEMRRLLDESLRQSEEAESHDELGALASSPACSTSPYGGAA
ncbi:helix-turn-helix domain-containing protein [Candidatus Bipolaricaulota bacterium]